MTAVDDLKSMKTLDQVVLGSGILALIVSLFFPIWGVSYLGRSSSINAWHGWAFFGMFLILVATGLAAVGSGRRTLCPSCRWVSTWQR